MTDFALVIMGNDWIVIAFVALVMFLGTKRMPEASRKLGRLVGELNRTKTTVQGEIERAKGEYGMPVRGPATSEREKLEFMARNLGINPTNRTDDELRDHISSRLGGESRKIDKDSKQKTK